MKPTLIVFLLSDLKAPTQEVSSGGSNGCISPDRKPKVPSKAVPRPLSPDSPEIISELQRYAAGSGSDATDGEAESGTNAPPSNKLLQKNCGSTYSGEASSHHDASVTNVTQPNKDTCIPQDLRIGSKRKAPSPSIEERAGKQPYAGKHSSSSPGFPFSGGYGLPPMGLNSAMLGGSVGHPLFMGSSSHYFQPPNSQLGDPTYMYRDMFGLSGVSAAPSSSSQSSSTTVTTSASSCPSTSVSAAGFLTGALPPYMLGPSMAGMLPPGFPLSYSPSLASLYSGSMLPGPAATPGPAGASFLSQYPQTAASGSSSSSPSSFSPSARSESHRVPVLENGGEVSGGSSSDDDDDVIEMMGQ